MANIFDVAAYILEKQGRMTTWKLQKLVYYAQAWSLAWDDRALFKEDFCAWANGPVAPTLYRVHRGKYQVDGLPQGRPDQIDADGSESIDAVLEYYGDKSPQWLSDLTHMEAPWQDARKGLQDGERGNKIISKGEMSGYYGSL